MIKSNSVFLLCQMFTMHVVLGGFALFWCFVVFFVVFFFFTF